MSQHIAHLGSRLKDARVKAGYQTAKDFYEKFKIKASTYSAHESGRNPLSLKTAMEYGKLLNVSASWLLTGGDEVNSEISKYILDYGQVPRDVLLNKMLNEVTTQYIKASGIQRGMKVAEFGCGTGSMSCWLAEHVGRTGTVYAIDKGYEQLSISRNRASKCQIDNIEFIRSEITNQPLNIKVDLIYMRCFLHHLKNPKEVIDMAIDILPSGGILVCMEPILSSFWSFPENQKTQKALHLYMQLGQKQGFDFDIGKKLHHYLENTSKLENFQAYIHQGAGVTKDEKSWIEMITSECASSYLEEKFVSESEMDNIISNISQYLEKSSTIATLPAFVCVTARKK